MNYVANDEQFPTSITFEDGRVVSISHAGDGGTFCPNLSYLTVSPASEYPKPCGICDGVIQSAVDLDWHGYGNCRDIPEPMLSAQYRVCEEIREIMKTYREQEAAGGVDTPGGLEHMGDVWRLLKRWDTMLSNPES